MKIAIIGAGFSGLATAWHLLQYPGNDITIFDPKGIGGGASGIAAGLLHPFGGLHCKLNWGGLEGMQATMKLLSMASQALGMAVAEETGLLRIAITEEQYRDYALCVQKYPEEAIWQDTVDIAGIVSHPSIFFQKALTVNCTAYLKGLWQACQKLGAKLETMAIHSLSELNAFDKNVIATGAEMVTFPELEHLRITPIKGQVLEFKWPSHLPHLPYPINSQAYLIADPVKGSCLVGSTFERVFNHPHVDAQFAFRDLYPKFAPFFPDLTESCLIDCRSGIRASTPDHLPIVKKISQKSWVIGGMNSKGLLYHAMMAEKISRLMMA